MTAMTEGDCSARPCRSCASRTRTRRSARPTTPAYGLGAAVFTQDVAKGERLARRVEAGAVCINDAAVNYLALELPMGGWKASGLGVRHGPAGLKKYTRQQAVTTYRLPLKREVHFFPYNARVTGLITKGMKLFYGAREGLGRATSAPSRTA